MHGRWQRWIGLAALAAVGVVGVMAFGGAGGARSAGAGGESAIAALQDAAGAPRGHVTFTRQGAATRVTVEAQGLPPGFHGFHVHAVGACDAGTGVAFTSAGGHHDRGGHAHGRHAGDLPLLAVQADGSASLSVLVDSISVAELFDADGSAVIVHAAPDNYGNIPTRYAPEPDAMTLATGDAGARIACGVIEPVAARGRR